MEYLWRKARRYTNKLRFQARLQKMAESNLKEMMIDDINEDANEDGIDSSSFEESGEWADGSITPPEGHRDFKSIELSGELCPVVKTPPTEPPTPSTIKWNRNAADNR